MTSPGKVYLSPKAEETLIWSGGCLCESPGLFNSDNGTEYLLPGGGGYEEL